MEKEYALGIDMGGTAIKYGICSSAGDLLVQETEDSPAAAPSEEILEKLVKIIEKSLEMSRQKGIAIQAIGIGTPGSVDVNRGFLMGATPNFKYWRNVGITDHLKKFFDIPIFVDNDANLMAYGEFVFGAGKEKQNVICITLGTGIGGGIIIDGEIYRGAFFAGAELGHMSIDFRGRRCRCGGIGCWEKYASATAMIQDYNQGNPQNPVQNAKEIFDRYHQKETWAREIVEAEVEYLAAGLGNIINIFNPELIIIGGGVSEAGDWFIRQVEERALQRAMDASRVNVKIEAACLGNRAGMLGASAFALYMGHRHQERRI